MVLDQSHESSVPVFPFLEDLGGGDFLFPHARYNYMFIKNNISFNSAI